MLRFAVIGLGRFGQRLARTLMTGDVEVIAVDRNGKSVEQVRDEVTLAVRLDSTDEEALKAQGIHEVDVAVVGIGVDFESAALTVATLKQLGVKRIIARAESDIQAKILTRVGADEIASPERESALRWAHRLMLPSLKQYVELGEGHSLIYIDAPQRFHNKTLAELDLRNKFGVNLIAIERGVAAKPDQPPQAAAAPVIEVPHAATKILPGDTLILVGSNDNIAELPRE
jgi:trk system potassium uptake protein TrkA